MTFQYPADKLILSHSTRSSFRRCPRLLEFNKLFGDGNRDDEQFAAEVGKALHIGFQHYMIHKDEDLAVWEFMKAYPHHLEWIKPENHYNRSLEACYITLMTMIQQNTLDELDIVHVKTQLPGNPILPAVEVPFAFEIVNSPMPIPVWFVGFTDLILYDRRKDRYMVDDIKTHRINIGDMSAKYQFDEQTVPYGIILDHMLGKEIEEFDVSYNSVYIDLIDPKSTTYTFTKTKDDIHDWYRGLCEDIARISRYYNQQWFPRATNGDTCFNFNKPCWFASECSNRDPEISARLVGGPNREGLFHDNQEPWVTVKLEWMEV